MSIIDKAKKNQALYIEGMLEAIKKSEASCEHFFDNIFGQQQIPNELAEAFELMRDAYIPASAAIEYALSYKKERLPISRIEAMPINVVPDWNSIFNVLSSLPADIMQSIVSKTDCDYGVKESLLSAITENREDIFVKIVKGYGKEVDFLIKTAAYYEIQNYKFEIGELEPGEGTVDEMIDISSEVGEKLGVSQNMFSAFLEPFRDIEQTPTAIRSLFTESYKSLLFVLFSEYEKFSIRELEIIDQYVKQPKYAGLYDEYKAEYDKENGTNAVDNIEEKTVDIPFDELVIFNGGFTAPNKKEFFSGIDPIIVKGGDDKFKQMVNYIANSGYIENSDRTKTLFTYRLTGKCRPKGELEKLIWDGRDNLSPNELLYIVRFSTDNSKDKYKKMQDFFVGPKFPTKDISGYADQAKIDFRRYLAELYPDVFKIKDISQYG